MKGFGYLVKEGFKNVWSNRIMSIASVCVLISCLVLTGAASLFSLNVSKMVDEVGESNETIVYILDSYSQLEAIYVGKEIEKVDNVASATFYSKEEAFEQYRETLGDSLFSRIEDRNPLPDSFIVVMHDLSKYDETVAEIQKIPGVDPDTILNRKDFADKLTRISSLVNLICDQLVCANAVFGRGHGHRTDFRDHRHRRSRSGLSGRRHGGGERAVDVRLYPDSPGFALRCGSVHIIRHFRRILRRLPLNP